MRTLVDTRLAPTTLGAQDREAANALVDRAMRPDATLAMTEDFPLLLGNGAASERLVVRGYGKILAHAASRDIDFRWIDGRRLRLANIGAVATDEAARGQGLASRLVEELEKRALRRGAHATVLWTDQPAFYERLGYRQYGRERQALFDLDSLEDATDADQNLEIGHIEETDRLALAEIRARDAFSVVRDRDAQSQIYDLPQSRTLVIRHAGRVLAWMTVGKGLDFAGTAAEWGGAHRLLPALMRAQMQREGTRRLLVPGPACDRGFQGLVASLRAESALVPLAMFKTVNERTLRSDFGAFVDRHAPGADPLEALVGSPALGEGALPFYFWGLDSQ